VLFRPQERGAALGAYGATIGLGTVLGPVAGGLLIQARLSADPWRAIFFVNVPIGVAAVVAGLLVLPESTAPDRPRLDLIGAILSAAGLALVLYPLAQGRARASRYSSACVTSPRSWNRAGSSAGCC
jgi:MFS family permease